MRILTQDTGLRPFHTDRHVNRQPAVPELFRVAVLTIVVLAVSIPLRAQARAKDLLSSSVEFGNIGPFGSKVAPQEPNISLGEVFAGSIGTAPVAITNYGTDAVTETSVPDPMPPFSATGIDPPATVGPGRTFSFTDNFAPAFHVVLMAYPEMTHGGSQQQAMGFTGTGVTGPLALTPSSVDFGNTTLGDQAQLPVIVRNTGADSVSISSASVSGYGYSITDFSLPQTLTPGQSISFTVVFSPTAPGELDGAATLFSTASNSPIVASLSGAGVYSHSVKLMWNPSDSAAVIGYNVYRALASGGPYSEITGSPVLGTQYTDDTVLAGQTYYYVTTAVTQCGESGYSNETAASVPWP
jgi:Abnormal spindle-like microcephaly-assoc'd, ASPM-SPD-2-Hydin